MLCRVQRTVVSSGEAIDSLQQGCRGSSYMQVPFKGLLIQAAELFALACRLAVHVKKQQQL